MTQLHSSTQSREGSRAEERPVMAGTILIVDDEPDLVDSLRFTFEREGYRVHAAYDGRAALDRIEQNPLPDIVLLDLMLPDMSGTDICRRLRQAERTRALPIIMVSARGDEIDRVVGFELGADDYVTKPFSMRELVLRTKSILRRHSRGARAERDERQLDKLRIDMDGHQVWVEDRRVNLTALEFRLLTTLVARQGRVQTRDTLLSDVWGVQADVTTRTVDTHVQRLRKKLGPAGAHIETLRGVGYRFSLPDQSPRAP